MSGFIMFIMFILNIFTIMAIIVLYMRQNRLANFERDQERKAREMEETMATFVLALKEENDRLIHTLSNNNVDTTELNVNEKNISRNSSASSQTQAVDRPNRQVVKVKQEDASSLELPDLPINEEDILEISRKPLEHGDNYKQSTSFQESLKQELKNHEQRAKPTLSDQVNNLLHEGLTTEEIAKKLNKGKTEIELLIRFNR
ncbi:hypothetical protein [Peribacillus huizhouensis]|uniref:Macrodomain Ter protein organizer (MatP/YcbG family) n=1 Tax=Peribacillus huizhouensis TaxID=1501239 RepID=A0ABR6CIL7_9BACI|nr:hypothetical protein [Peribacillus huizhouensis]MBA9024843.1 macrodomain Ter protein organizer (MatP/YcbG family) [Peribacillus huizhouensis]